MAIPAGSERGTCLGSLAEPENNNKPVPCLLLFLKSDGKDIVFPLVLKRSQPLFLLNDYNFGYITVRFKKKGL